MKLNMGFFDGGPVKIAINFFCALILYIMFYIIYIASKYIHKAIIWRTREVVSIPFYAILDIILYILAWISVILIVFIGTVFLVLYIFWKVINKIGFGFLINGETPFSECISTGLFPFFDRLVDIIYGNDAFGKRLQTAGMASSEFLKTFMKDAFGIVFEGYELDEEYLTAAFNVFLFNNMYADDVEKCLAVKQKFLDVSKQKTPVIKITYDDTPSENSLTDTDNMRIKNCIRDNTIDIPTDANTVERLQIIFSNAVAKQKCYLNISNNLDGNCSAKSASCMVSDMENAVRNIGKNIGMSSLTSFNNYSASTSEYYDNSVNGIEENKNTNDNTNK